MSDFNPARAVRDASQRYEQIASGEKLVPVSAAVIAVLAALATLFAHHSSTFAISQKNESILYQSKAADQYNYFESKRIKAEINQSLIDSGLVKSGTAAHRAMLARISKENAEGGVVLKKAKALEAKSGDYLDRSERFMVSYENYQIAATLFEVSIVFVSITALMKSKVLLYVAGGATLVGLVFLAVGLLH